MAKPLVSVTIKGDLAAQVEKALEARRVEIERALEATGDNVRNTARSLVPKDTGKLHDSIAAHNEGLEVEVGVFDKTAYYGRFIEHGTSTRGAQPFMLPAFERERTRFLDRLKEAIS